MYRLEKRYRPFPLEPYRNFYCEDSGKEMAEGAWRKGICASLGTDAGSEASRESKKFLSSLSFKSSVGPVVGEAGVDS